MGVSWTKTACTCPAFFVPSLMLLLALARVSAAATFLDTVVRSKTLTSGSAGRSSFLSQERRRSRRAHRCFRLMLGLCRIDSRPGTRASPWVWCGGARRLAADANRTRRSSSAPAHPPLNHRETKRHAGSLRVDALCIQRHRALTCAVVRRSTVPSFHRAARLRK